MAREIENSEEELRQQGREEVLDWLVQKEIISYSKPDNQYFIYDWRTEWLTILPWTKSNK